jgi:hypothetical protein
MPIAYLMESLGNHSVGSDGNLRLKILGEPYIFIAHARASSVTLNNAMKTELSEIIEKVKPDLLHNLLILRFSVSKQAVISLNQETYRVKIITLGEECPGVIEAASAYGFLTNGYLGQVKEYKTCSLVYGGNLRQFIGNLVDLLTIANFATDEGALEYELVAPTRTISSTYSATLVKEDR